MEKLIIKNAYTPTESVVVTFPQEEYPTGKTQQHFKDDSDINNIMARFISTGLMDYVQTHEPQYGDCTGITFENAMDTVVRAQNLFDALPAEWRKRFQNSPEVFLDFVQDPDNLEEAIKMGLATRRPVVKPQPTTPAVETTGGASTASAGGSAGVKDPGK